MDSMDNFRERFEALEQRTEHLQQHTRRVERRRRWWNIPWGVAAVAALALGMLLALAVETLALEANRLTIGLNFTGSTVSDSFVTPPDTMGAVGPDHIVELINGRYSVYRKQDGILLQSSGLNEFWQAAGVNIPLPFFPIATADPRILYDPVSQRWFASSVDNPFAGGLIASEDRFLLAVSQSADPTAGWLGLAIDSDSTHLRYADFPTLGFDRDGVYLAANMLPFPGLGGDLRVTIVAVSKADLLAATSPITVVKALGNTPADSMVMVETTNISLDSAMPTSFLASEAPTVARATEAISAGTDSSLVHVTVFENIPVGETGVTIQPVVNLDNHGLPAALLSAFNSAGGVFKRTNIVGTITAPLLDTSDGFIDVTPFSAIFGAEQPNQVQPPLEIANGSIFHTSVVLRNSAFWGVHTVNTGGRAALRWFQIDADHNVLLQEGLITDPNLDFFYGSIAVNEFGDVVIGFTGSGPSQFASSYAVLGTTVSGITTFSEPLLLQAGVATYRVLQITEVPPGRNRWGDYSATVVDPTDPFTFWTFQEWVSADNTWATQITQLKLLPPSTSCLETGTARLRGRVRTAVEPIGIPDVIMTLNGPGGCQDTTTTNATGHYVFRTLGSGIYTVTPEKAGCTFTPASRTVTLVEADLQRARFRGICLDPEPQLSVAR